MIKWPKGIQLKSTFAAKGSLLKEIKTFLSTSEYYKDNSEEVIEITDINLEEEKPLFSLKNIVVAKGPNKSSLIVRIDDDNKNKDEILFFTFGDKDHSNTTPRLIPSLFILHQFPDLLRKVIVDKGALKPILTGAPLMLAGVDKSNSGDVKNCEVVGIYGLGMESAIGVGVMLYDIHNDEEVGGEKMGEGIELVFRLRDEWWKRGVGK